MARSLPGALLQFQTPDWGVSVSRSGDTYTLKRNIGQGRVWEVTLARTVETLGIVHVLKNSTITGGPSDFTIHSTTSVWEYALGVMPPDASTYTNFIGNGHGREDQTALTFKVDGSPVEMADGATETGETVEVTRTTALYHDDAEGKIGDGTCVYTMTRDGLDVDWSIVWTRDLEAGVCYGAMMPTNEAAFDWGRTKAGAAQLTSNDNSVNVPSNDDAGVAWMWESAGNHAAVLWLKDLDTVRDWNDTDARYLWLQDRSDGTTNKVYAQFTGPAIASGDRWIGSTRYVADYLDAGAAATLDAAL